MPKTCSACKIEKEADCFTKRSSSKDGLSSQCKDCQKEWYKKYYAKNKEKILSKNRTWIKNNRAKVNLAYSRRRRRDIEKHRLKDRAYYRKNSVMKLEKHRIWSLSERGILWRRKYVADRRRDWKIRLIDAVRCRTRDALNGNRKTKKTMQLLGCSPSELKTHLEGLFKDGMTWENYGLHGWHIDHIIPCASFDLTKPEEQRRCFHYTNLQPLWAKDNLSKGDGLTFHRNSSERGNMVLGTPPDLPRPL